MIPLILFVCTQISSLAVIYFIYADEICIHRFGCYGNYLLNRLEYQRNEMVYI